MLLGNYKEKNVHNDMHINRVKLELFNKNYFLWADIDDKAGKHMLDICKLNCPETSQF